MSSLVTETRRDKTVFGISTAVGLLALAVLAGWYLHKATAVQVLPGMVPMQFNTALCFLALAMAGIGLSRQKTSLVVVGASFAAVMGLAVMGEFGIGLDLGLDTFSMCPGNARSRLIRDAWR